MPNPELNERFQALLAEAEAKWGRGTQTKIARAMDTSTGSVSAWKKKGYTGSGPQLDALSTLLSGEKYPEPKLQGTILDDAKRPVKQGVRELFDYLTAPIIAYAQGGEGAYPEDLGHAVPRIPVPCKDPNCYVLQLEGDSMEPIYREGDLLVVAPNSEPMNNDLVIVKTTDEEVLFKKLKHPRKGELFEFHSFNPNHPPLYLRPDQIHRVSVVDCVIRPLKRKVRAMTVSESASL